MKKVLILTAFLLTFAVSYAYSVTLVDVPSGHWAEDAVKKLVDAGLIEGYPDGTYKGDRPMTRYEYAMVVARLMDKIQKEYALKSDIKGGTAASPAMDDSQLKELQGIVEKLAAEFKDELEALKVKVDENSAKISSLEKKVDNAFGVNVSINGNVRQRIDVPSTDMQTTGNLVTLRSLPDFLGLVYAPTTAGVAAEQVRVNTGYQFVPYLELNGEAGKDKRVAFSVGLKQYFDNDPIAGPIAAANDDNLELEHGYVDLNFSNDVKELDALKVRSGYQFLDYGPYGMLVDTAGIDSMPGVTVTLGKDRVSLTGSGLLAGANDMVLGTAAALDPIGANTLAFNDGLGTYNKDLFFTARLGVDLDQVKVGVNVLGNGIMKETGWGADVDADLLTRSNFLTGLRAEYMTLTDTVSGNEPGATTVADGSRYAPAGATDIDDVSYMIGIDVFETKKTLLTVSYADLPAATTLTSMDANPFTEYDSVCSLGLDVGGGAGTCLNKEGGLLFPMGFKGLGLEASHIILGDVKLGAKAILGDFAGGCFDDDRSGTCDAGEIDMEGVDYPSYGALSITKPINSESTFRVEYLRQGFSDILLDRVRGELLINF